MDGLDEFEKQLAAEKAKRDRHDDRKKHHDRHRDDHGHRRRHRDDDDENHRHKRRRRSSRDEHNGSRHGHKDRDRHRDRDRNETHKEAHDKPSTEAGSSALVRDAWMTAPSALDVEHINRPAAKEKTPPKEPERVCSVREINRGISQQTAAAEPPTEPEERVVDYTFGDSGSSWRMTKLRGVQSMAEETGRPVEDIALERFGSLQEFDDAREEKQELDRAKSYGKGYSMKEKPTGDFYKERLAKQKPLSSPPPPRQPSPSPPAAATVVAPMDQTALNRLRAQLMKAKLRRAPNAAQLEQEYNRAAAAFSTSASDTAAAAQSVVLSGQDSRLLAGHVRNEAKPVDTRRGRARGTVVANDDMTIDDMLREERRTKGQAGGEGMRLAERIAKDAKFDNDLEYMDENAEKLAKRVHRSEMNLKNMAVGEFQKVNRILESCPLCHRDNDNGTQTAPPLAPVLALGTRVFLTLATEPEVSPGGAVIVPTTHRRNLLECDDDEWEELRNFMKSLTRMYHAQGREVLFYENAAAPARHRHAAMIAVPIPYAEGATAPAYFKEAFLSADEEWAQHKKIIDTGAAAAAREHGLGRMAFRRSIAKEMPYFHVWFTLDGGLGHIVEDAARWPKGDLFAREVIGGIVDAEPHVVRKQGRWQRADPRVDGFKKEWRKYDWTRVLIEDA